MSSLTGYKWFLVATLFGFGGSIGAFAGQLIYGSRWEDVFMCSACGLLSLWCMNRCERDLLKGRDL